MELIRENNAITQEEMSARIGVSFGAIKKNVSLLKEKDILIRTGSTKKGRLGNTVKSYQLTLFNWQ